MKRKLLLILTLFLIAIAMTANADTMSRKEKIAAKKAEIKAKIKAYEQFDTIRDSTYWKRALMHGKLDTRDTTVLWPKFLKLCVNVYNWGDKAFNSYDPAYVLPTGKKWKIFLKSNNWVNSYAMRFDRNTDKTKLYMLSDPASNLGVTLAFMAVSGSYSLNLNKIIGGQAVTHRRFDFNFCCARFAADMYYIKDHGRTIIRSFGNYNNGHDFNYKFNGKKILTYGVDAYYFFNNRKYSQGAAYNFSKLQKRRSGSFIAGIALSHQDMQFDFSSLPEGIQAQFPNEIRQYRFNYNDYCLMLGYGYNWILGRHWIANLTAMPVIGLKHSFAESTDGKQQMTAVNLRMKFSFVYNRNQFFLGIIGRYDGRTFTGETNDYFNSLESLDICSGFRF